MSKIDNEPLAFGKHVFKTPEQIADEDPKYIVWLYEEYKGGNKLVSKFLYEACKDEVAENRADAGDEHF